MTLNIAKLSRHFLIAKNHY